MKRVILVLSSAFALGFWSEAFAESFGCPKPYPSPNPMSATSFAKIYGGTWDDWANSVQQTSDGGYILAGLTYSFGAGYYDIFLIKTDVNGNIIWAKTYGGTDWDWANSVQQTSDGGYILAGLTYSFGAGLADIFLIKTDANGNIQWAKTYGGTGDDRAYSVQQMSDGGYIVAGWTTSFGAGSRDFSLSRRMRTETYNGLKLMGERVGIMLIPFNRHPTVDIL
jgi:hypothetical protein